MSETLTSVALATIHDDHKAHRERFESVILNQPETERALSYYHYYIDVLTTVYEELESRLDALEDPRFVDLYDKRLHRAEQIKADADRTRSLVKTSNSISDMVVDLIDAAEKTFEPTYLLGMSYMLHGAPAAGGVSQIRPAFEQAGEPWSSMLDYYTYCADFQPQKELGEYRDRINALDLSDAEKEGFVDGCFLTFSIVAVINALFEHETGFSLEP